MRLNERITFRAAAKDPVVAAAVEEFATRRSTILRLLDPRLLPRVLGSDRLAQSLGWRERRRSRQLLAR